MDEFLYDEERFGGCIYSPTATYVCEVRRYQRLSFQLKTRNTMPCYNIDLTIGPPEARKRHNGRAAIPR